MHPCFFWKFHTYQHGDFPSDSSSLFNRASSLLMQQSRPTLALKPLIPLPPTSNPLPLHPHHRLVLLAVLYTSCFLFPQTPSGFFNGMLGVSETGALTCNTLFRLLPLTLIYLFLSGFLGSLLSNLNAPSPGLSFSLLMPHTQVAASSFSSGRAYPSRNFLPPLFPRLIPTLIM